jgi:hypothetical protein
MSLRARAFATLTAVGLLVLIAALLAGAVLGSQSILLAQGRAEKAQGARSSIWKTADDLLSAIKETWNADDQTIDAWWADRSGAFPSVTELISLSGRVNLNSMTPFLLMDSELRATLLNKSVEDFTAYRSSKGPFSRVEDYKDYFQGAALRDLYCAYSSFDVNTADEIVLEKVLAIRTGSEALASTLRSRLREYRIKRRALADADWDAIIGASKNRVGELCGTAPELDVNASPAAVVRAIFRYPDLKLEQADAKLRIVLSGRASRPWNDDTLRQALGVDKKSPILAFLGTRTRFIRGSIGSGTHQMGFTASVAYSVSTPPKITVRILETRWTSS